MDYRLTDALADPPGQTEHLHTEKLVRLPEGAWCFHPPEEAPPIGEPRGGGITFGCFNAQAKITGEALALWARLLHEVPGARLVLKNSSLGNASVQARVRQAFLQHGIAPERVGFQGWLPYGRRFDPYEQIDVMLDTFPYHGTTTTCEALWMGVPVVTLAGRTHASRVGVSLLHRVGLPALIAADADEYVAIAAGFARDPERLAHGRRSLRAQMAASPLMDAPRFARAVEGAYRQMWWAWCAEPRCAPPCL